MQVEFQLGDRRFVLDHEGLEIGAHTMPSLEGIALRRHCELILDGGIHLIASKTNPPAVTFLGDLADTAPGGLCDTMHFTPDSAALWAYLNPKQEVKEKRRILKIFHDGDASPLQLVGFRILNQGERVYVDPCHQCLVLSGPSRRAASIRFVPIEGQPGNHFQLVITECHLGTPKQPDAQ